MNRVISLINLVAGVYVTLSTVLSDDPLDKKTYYLTVALGSYAIAALMLLLDISFRMDRREPKS